MRFVRSLRLFLGVCAAVFAIGASSVLAAPRIIATDGYYIIGDGMNESLAVAKERAKTDALRNASMQAGVYIESLTVVKEGYVTKDEIAAISANVMQVKGEPIFKVETIENNVIRYKCHITVAVDADNINAKLIQDKRTLSETAQRNRELEAEVSRLNSEMDKLKQKYSKAATEQERKEIRNAVKRNDDEFLAAGLNEQGAKLCAKGRYQEALVVFTQALAKNPKLSYAYHNRGIAYGKIQKYREAVEDFSRAITLDDNYATAYGGRGFAYFGLDDYVSAAQDFSKAIALNPSYAEAYYGRGNAYMSVGHYEEALIDYERALELNPNLEAAKANRDAILTAMNG